MLLFILVHIKHFFFFFIFFFFFFFFFKRIFFYISIYSTTLYKQCINKPTSLGQPPYKLAFKQHQKKYNKGTKNNEINGYLNQIAFEGTYPGWANSLKDINKKSLFNIRNSSGSYVYDFLNKDKK